MRENLFGEKFFQIKLFEQFFYGDILFVTYINFN